jgi:hypothetical protein
LNSLTGHSARLYTSRVRRQTRDAPTQLAARIRELMGDDGVVDHPTRPACTIDGHTLDARRPSWWLAADAWAVAAVVRSRCRRRRVRAARGAGTGLSARRRSARR